MHENNSFITLTYDEEHLPHRGQLQHKDFADFVKRARKKYKFIYYMAGEYGTLNGRPHFHAGLFGHDWDDKKPLKITESGERIYTSASLDKLWGQGFTSTAEVTFESMAYVARYCMSKITGDMAEEHYKRFDYLGEYQLNPEYNVFSNGIGKSWLNKYESDVYTYDYVIVNGVKTRPPKYYDRIFGAKNEKELQALKDERAQLAYERRADNTPERLQAKETVAKAKTNQLKRGKV